ncbi:MAG: hypothetical protein EZS28_004175 [Streblomastix strix]|uniref:Uncharacterized protein n=1 Tax=Streblomastix strix TaxID=222440 RepID=A0A5J4WZ88_9EUKA|nr:MAG: hypothetical protein EZS28_004175 [Streblomastix strix]
MEMQIKVKVNDMTINDIKLEASKKNGKVKRMQKQKEQLIEIKNVRQIINEMMEIEISNESTNVKKKMKKTEELKMETVLKMMMIIEVIKISNITIMQMKGKEQDLD